MRIMSIAATALAVAAISSGGAAAAACEAGKDAADLTNEDAQALYECLEADLYEGYQKGDKRWMPAAYVADYRNWTKANTLPAAPGFHDSRYLITFVNETGADAYMEYAENPTIPAGTVIAKESFGVTNDGRAIKGPLFFMEKVAAGTSPATNDWYYMMVAPNGRPQAVDVATACHACHQENFGETGGLGYPVEEVRVVK